MNILYLHGLDSKLNDDKRAILDKLGTVFAPELDYRSNPEVFGYLVNNYKSENIDCIIGSSMGGFMGYYFALHLGVPALLFNPALSIRSVKQIILEKNIPDENQYFSIVLGSLDEVVPAVSTLKFFSEHLLPTVRYHVKIRPDLAHQISLDIFEEECSTFLRSC